VISQHLTGALTYFGLENSLKLGRRSLRRRVSERWLYFLHLSDLYILGQHVHIILKWSCVTCM